MFQHVETNILYFHHVETSIVYVSARGEYICLLEMTNDTTGVTYLHMWNNDTTLQAGVERINCYVITVLLNVF